MDKKIKIIVAILILIAFVELSVNVQAQSDEGLVAEWHFDEGSGNVLEDSSGNGNDGVIRGASWVDGKVGQALSFDGMDDYVEILHPFSLLNTGKVTIEAWTKPISSTTINGKTVIQIGAECTPSGALLQVPSGYGDILFCTVVPNYGYLSVYSAFPGCDQWLHIVGTYDGCYLKIYVDGRLKSKVNCTGSMTTPTSGTNIGAIKCDSKYHTYCNGAYFFNGLIDEVRVYNRALTADEIKEQYEGKQTALTLTKSASPHAIKQGQTTTITLTVKNTGTTEKRDIEVTDTIPPDLIFVSGETSKTYASLKPKDSREFQYILQTKEAGTFNLDPATATYVDEKGNYHTVKSKTAAITVIPSAESQPSITTKSSTTEISTACVHLYGEKTDVVLGEDILLKLSAVNKITKPTMTLQVILIPPSGMSVISADFVESGAGLYTSTYVIEPGMGRDIGVGIRSNQVGDFVVNGEIIYYFGDDKEHAEDHTLSLPIKVRASSQQSTFTPAAAAAEGENGTPGFEALFAVAGLLLAAFLIKRRVE